MILISHGALDYVSDRTSGIAKITDQIRADFPLEDIREVDAEDDVNLTIEDMSESLDIFIGYSNGGDQVREAYDRVLRKARDPNDTRFLAHFILIDFVYKGVKQLFDRADLTFPTTVQSCFCFYRTRVVHIPPLHNKVDLGPDNYVNIPVDAGHGEIIMSDEVQIGVPERVRELLRKDQDVV